MKRGLSILLACVLLAGIAGCSAGEKSGGEPATTTDMNAFIDKYERADLDDVLEDPADFLDDYYGVIGADETDFADWEVNEQLSDESIEAYDIECVLFNLSARISVTSAIGPDDLKMFFTGITLKTGSEESDFEMAMALCEWMFDKRGDAAGITIDGTESNEHKLREQVFMEKRKESEFRCKWEVGDDASNEGFSSYLIGYSRALTMDSVSTFVSLSLGTEYKE